MFQFYSSKVKGLQSQLDPCHPQNTCLGPTSHQCFTQNSSWSKEPAMLAYFTTTFLVAWTPSSSWESSLPGSEYSVTSSNAVLE